MKNKKVLIITYHFPPEGGPAVQRILKFSKLLPESGYEPIVLTTTPSSGILDESLKKDIPEDLIVCRSKDYGALIPGEIRKKLKSNLLFPDKQNLWKLTAVRKGLQLVQKHKIELILSTSPPQSVHLIAQKIAESAGIPWVADFRDEWTTNSVALPKTLQPKHRSAEMKVLINCTEVVTITESAKSNFRSLKADLPVSVILNGFDEDDFKHIESKNERNSRLNITYCGRLNKLHSPISLFNALNSINLDKPELLKKISVNIIGGSGNEKWLREFPGLQDVVQFEDYLPHDQCLNIMSSSDVLLLLATDMANTEMLPAKMFEYYYLRKPVLAIVSHEGELTENLQQYGSSYIGLQDDIVGLKNIMLGIIDMWENESLSKNTNEDFITKFSRRKQAKQLAGIFDRIIER